MSHQLGAALADTLEVVRYWPTDTGLAMAGRYAHQCLEPAVQRWPASNAHRTLVGGAGRAITGRANRKGSSQIRSDPSPFAEGAIVGALAVREDDWAQAVAG